MMKILLAISPSDVFGGGQKVFVVTISELILQNHEVVVVLPDESLVHHFELNNTKIYLVDYRSISCIVKINNILRHEKVDIINTYLPKCSLLFSFVNLLYRVPICCTLLNAVIHEKLNKIQTLIYPLLYFVLYRICDGIIVNSEQNKQHFMAVARIKGEFIKVIYSGIELEQFSNVPTTEFETNKFVVGMVGRLSKEKGPSYLIEALSALEGIDFECLIVGEGPLRKQLEELVEKRHLQERVKFLGFQENVIQFMQKMDVIVLPSINETFGITIVEAFALKKVVVASEVGGIPELVKNNVTGLLFPAKDSAALAERLLYIHNNKEDSVKMGENGYEFAMRNFTSAIMAANTLAYYKTLVKREM